MKHFFTILLLALALPVYAAELSLPVTHAVAGTTFAVPVIVELGNEKANAVEGVITLPDGVSLDSFDRSGSAFPLFAQGPSYVVGSHTVEFTAGTPGSVSGTVLAFTMRLTAEHPGVYTLTPSEFSAYRADGKGTRVAIATEPVSFDVATAGSKVATNPSVPVAPPAPTPLFAQIGKDPAIAGGSYFVAIAGGGDPSGLDHYEVQQAWWGRAVRVPGALTYHVLADQSLSTSVRVTAVSHDGGRSIVTLHPSAAWPEKISLAILFALFALALFLLLRFVRKHQP